MSEDDYRSCRVRSARLVPNLSGFGACVAGMSIGSRSSMHMRIHPEYPYPPHGMALHDGRMDGDTKGAIMGRTKAAHQSHQQHVARVVQLVSGSDRNAIQEEHVL